MNEDITKKIELLSMGMNPKGIEKTWAWNNIEEARKLNNLFMEFSKTVSGIIYEPI